jgi:hypothetical protein
MVTVHLTGEITESGELRVNLPDGLPPGKFEIALEFSEQTWVRDDLTQLLQPEPMTGREIVAAGLTGGWKDEGISDGAAWVQEQRRQRQERRGW